MTEIKHELHRKLREERAAVLATLEGVGEYDLRRPMTPTGTNLLGLVKHLASVEYRYLGDSFGRPAPETLSWVEDGSDYEGADMWAKADESSDYLIGLYRRAAAHSDETIELLELDSPASVPHWPHERRQTTLGVLLIRVLDETAHHAGHLDIVREMIDGRAASDTGESGTDWSAYVARIQDSADTFRGTGG
jgi:hypothetical protein